MDALSPAMIDVTMLLDADLALVAHPRGGSRRWSIAWRADAMVAAADPEAAMIRARTLLEAGFPAGGGLATIVPTVAGEKGTLP